MDDYSMSESNISALKETLYAQQHLLQKLYNELEAEREASATAANEALSVILRLEGEKAAVKMEAEQYKRLSEEKIFHAEESLAIIEDVIYQKEMEVAALDHQVQAYRYKLLSMGCTDPGFGELKFHEKARTGETSDQNIARRNSAPACCKYKIAISEGESCGIVERDSILRSADEKTRLDMCDQASDLDKKGDSSSSTGISSYWDQIMKLDVRVKEIAGANYVSCKSESSSLSSCTSSGKNESDLCRPNELDALSKPDCTKSVESRNCVAVESSCSMSVHDVFEVPKVDENLSSNEVLEREDVVHPEEVKMDGGDDPSWLKKVLQFDQSKKCLKCSDINCNLVVVQPTTSMPGSRVNRISEIEKEVDTSAELSNREEELKLLNEIKEKLDLLHDEIRGLKVKKSPTRHEPSLSVLSEAMLYFWL